MLLRCLVPLFVFCLGGLAATGATYGQKALPHPLRQALPSQYVQTHWDKADGLPQNTVAAVVQARNGYLWVGTQEGLARFDGHRFRLFTTDQAPGLPSNDVTALYEDPHGHLWIGTTDGLALFSEGKISAIEEARGKQVRALHVVGEALWVATLDGLFQVRRDTVRHYTEADGLPDLRVLSLQADARGQLYVGTYTGLVRFDGRRFQRVDRVPATDIRALHLLPDGRMVVGTESGLFQYATGTTAGAPAGTFEPVAGSAQRCTNVRTLSADGRGRLWAGTQGNGLCLIDGGTVTPLPAALLPDGDVLALAPDAEGGLWVGLHARGLLRLHRGPFTTLGTPEGLPADGVLSVLEAQDGSLWVGTEGGGLGHIRHGVLTTYTGAHGLGAPNPYILSLAQQRDGTLWAAPLHQGLCRFDGAAFSCLTTRDGLLSDNVLSLFETADGTLWIGTDNGLNALRDGRLEDMSPLHEVLREQPILALEAAGGALWAGTLTGGLVRVTRNNAEQHGSSSGLPDDEVLALHRDASGTLWVGFDGGGGLCRLAAGATRFRCYGTRDGLFDDKVLQLLSDDRGFLWMGSNKGYVRVPLSSFDAYDAGRLDQLPHLPTGRTPASGLRDVEASGGLQPTTWRGHDGTLFFATTGGLGIVHPDAAEHYRNLRPPPVYIESVRLDGEAVSDDAPVLPARPRDLRFDFSVLSFHNPDSVRVRFRLDGFDEAWHVLEPGERSYTYSSLDAGTYTFRVQAANADGIWNAEGATYSFRVRAHPTETWWFYLLCGLAALGAGVALSRARVRVLERQRHHLEAVVADRTAELRAHEAELQRINEGLEAEVQRQFAILVEERQRYEGELIAARDRAEASARLKSTILDNMSHEIRTPMAGILGFTEILKIELDEHHHEFVDHIDVAGRRLLAMLNNILELSRLESADLVFFPTPFDAAEKLHEVAKPFFTEARQKQLALTLDAPPVLPVEMDSTAFETLVQNLLSNALKFTEEGHVAVTLAGRGGGLWLEVRDTGVGIGEGFLPELFEPFTQESDGLTRSHEGSGIGLAIVRGYASAMGGTVEVASEKGRGTTFTVWLPQVAGGDGAARAAEATAVSP